MKSSQIHTQENSESLEAKVKAEKVSKIADSAVRKRVLNTRESFILQAPAGSGKTELLTQRFLALLAEVDQPEKIVAITFTRKAAAEMKQRISESLLLARQAQPKDDPEKTRWRLAQKALRQDQRYEWELAHNPARLQVTTIDSLCAKIIALQPMLSQIGAMPELCENAEPLYAEAVERLLMRIDEPGPVADALKQLFLYKDIQVDQIKDMLQRMLAKRLQWLIPDTQTDKPWQSASLLTALEQLIHDRLNILDQLVPLNIRAALIPIFKYIARNLTSKDDNWQERKPCLGQVIEHDHWQVEDRCRLIQYKALAEIVLTASGKKKILTKVTAKQGIPAVNKKLSLDEQQQQKQMKAAFESILEELRATDGLLDAFLELECLPNPDTNEDELNILQAVLTILPYAAAELTMLFSERNSLDYSALNWGALQALQDDDAPTELALMLDYKIEHLLIDEFQDTSTPQIKLLKQLISGWDESDNKTLFLVGDPMQSIYRFRDANVGIFMSIAEHGIDNIKPTYLKLVQNFRSSSAIVDWVNQTFTHVMPPHDDIANGAVSYSSAAAFHPAEAEDGFYCEAWYGDRATTSEHLVAKIVNDIKLHLANNTKRDRPHTLAVLGQSRKQLAQVASMLRQAAIPFQGIELEPIKDADSVRELRTLALALSNPWCDLYWAALLRSPAFALSQTELVDIFGELDEDAPDAFSRVGQWMHEQAPDVFCRQQWQIIEQTLQFRGRKPFAKWVLGCYMALTGCAQYLSRAALADLALASEALATVVEKGDFLDQQTAEEALNGLYAMPDPDADEQVQLMTMHKSKGLEFDTVILPLMSHRAPSNTELLRWGDFLSSDGQPHFLFAVSQEAGGEKSNVFRWLEHVDKKKSAFELQRLLYVATTRAKKRLMIYTELSEDSKTGQAKAPAESSLSAILWSQIESNAVFHRVSENADKQTDSIESTTPKECFLADSFYWQLEPNWLEKAQNKWRSQIFAHCLPTSEMFGEGDAIAEINGGDSHTGAWVEPDVAALQGVFIHWLFEQVTTYKNALVKPIQTSTNILLDCWGESWKQKLRMKAEALLPFAEPDLILSTVELSLTALEYTLNDEFGYQILSAGNGASEQTLIKALPLGTLNRIVDRTFVKDGVRFIVDYKTATPAPGEKLEQFFTQQCEEYRSQLEDYAKLFKQLENRRILAGLYFPLLPAWRPLVELASK